MSQPSPLLSEVEPRRGEHTCSIRLENLFIYYGTSIICRARHCGGDALHECLVGSQFHPNNLIDRLYAFLFSPFPTSTPKVFYDAPHIVRMPALPESVWMK